MYPSLLSSCHNTLTVLGISWMLTALPAAAATFTVGADPACDFDTLDDAVAAAAANPFADVIRLASNQTYTGVELDLTGQSVNLEGGYETCASPVPNGKTTLDGLGSSYFTPVIEIGDSGSHEYTLSGMVLQGGENGAVRITGRHQVVLSQTDILKNKLWGVSMTDGATGEGSDLVVDEDTTIFWNAGHGIHCTGSGRIKSFGSIFTNTTSGAGGGVSVEGCDLGVYLPAKIQSNSAVMGGGIYAGAGSHVELRSAPGNRFFLGSNDALRGGAIYAASGATVTATNVQIWQNWADESGAGAYVEGSGTVFTMDVDSDCPNFDPHTLWDHCSAFYQNGFVLAGEVGGAIAVVDGGIADLRRTRIFANEAQNGAVGWVTGPASLLRLESCLVDANYSESLFLVSEEAELLVEHSTLLAVGGYFHEALSGATVSVHSSIIDGGVASPSSGAATYDYDCVLTSSSGSLPSGVSSGSTVIEGTDPLFTDPLIRDFTLSAASPAVDFCDDAMVVLTGADLRNQPRPVDQPGHPNAPYGPYDLGAFERPLD